jgi:hypothetical protein
MINTVGRARLMAVVPLLTEKTEELMLAEDYSDLPSNSFMPVSAESLHAVAQHNTFEVELNSNDEDPSTRGKFKLQRKLDFA